jgi:hypothetical protein
MLEGGNRVVMGALVAVGVLSSCYGSLRTPARKNNGSQLSTSRKAEALKAARKAATERKREEDRKTAEEEKKKKLAEVDRALTVDKVWLAAEIRAILVRDSARLKTETSPEKGRELKKSIEKMKKLLADLKAAEKPLRDDEE